MERILFITLLYDFYGELLTEKQKNVIEMYYLNDLSLTEIGEELEVSRQAVLDLLRRSEKILQTYEDKLQLLDRFLEQKKSIEQIKELIGNIDKNSFDECVLSVKLILNELL